MEIKLNLKNGISCPYKEPNNNLPYIHSSSNHLPQIIEQLPNTISGRLLKNSSNQKEFKIAEVKYEDAPKKSGYDVDLTYSISKLEKPKMRIQRKIFFSPPFSKSVSTHVANIFLQLLI